MRRAVSELTPERVTALRNALADLERIRTLSAMVREAVQDSYARQRRWNAPLADAMVRAIGEAIADCRSVAGE